MLWLGPDGASWKVDVFGPFQFKSPGIVAMLRHWRERVGVSASQGRYVLAIDLLPDKTSHSKLAKLRRL